MSRPGDPRLGDLIKAGIHGALVLLGHPIDEGVRRNGGRVGARHGPAAVREFLRSLGTVVNPEYDIDLSPLAVSDGGNSVEADTGDLEGATEKLADLIASVLKTGGIPFTVGGGNDQSFGSYLGYRKIFPTNRIAVVNIDAHLDVRPLVDGRAHSGSPFRQMLSAADWAGTYTVFAGQGSQCSAEHVNYIRAQGGSVVWLSVAEKARGGVVGAFESLLAQLSTTHDDIFFSFDLDAIRGSDAPGVSCSSALGLSAHDALEMCRMAGQHPKVRLCDLSEYNPVIERYRTGKLVAQMFYYFALGLARRPRPVIFTPC